MDLSITAKLSLLSLLWLVACTSPNQPEQPEKPYRYQGTPIKVGVVGLVHTHIAYFTSVIRGEHEPQPYDLSSMENNLMLIQILEAARGGC